MKHWSQHKGDVPLMFEVHGQYMLGIIINVITLLLRAIIWQKYFVFCNVHISVIQSVWSQQKSCLGVRFKSKKTPHGLFHVMDIPWVIQECYMLCRYAELCGLRRSRTHNQRVLIEGWHRFSTLHLLPNCKYFRDLFKYTYFDETNFDYKLKQNKCWYKIGLVDRGVTNM